MDALRWLLLLLGAIILIAIYWYGKRAEARRAPRDDERDEPYFQPDAHDEAEPVAPEDEWDILPIARPMDDAASSSVSVPETRQATAATEVAASTAPEQAPPARPVEPPPPTAARPPRATSPEEPPEADFEVILIVHVVAGDELLSGPSLTDAFDELNLELDERGVFIRADELGGVPQFGVVNMVKPGVFAEEALASLETPGISLFLTLPGPDSPMVAFRAMSDCARRLAERFDARLEDETHSTLSTQTLTHMEERVREFIQHRARTARSTR